MGQGSQVDGLWAIVGGLECGQRLRRLVAQVERRAAGQSHPRITGKSGVELRDLLQELAGLIHLAPAHGVPGAGQASLTAKRARLVPTIPFRPFIGGLGVLAGSFQGADAREVGIIGEWAPIARRLLEPFSRLVRGAEIELELTLEEIRRSAVGPGEAISLHDVQLVGHALQRLEAFRAFHQSGLFIGPTERGKLVPSFRPRGLG